ncbi:uncharacterized protein DNG_01715 [Cephalotrichum gorgonifer]|uniref:Uncharacterized protein n=1 Tax=Cephalotrichum gorgonifer TaxID=2041049 RepID=A0AAE8MSB0_9PEZI|nr:uncharacterized protein DNG_01715 [Cephalotrichum gorgonifer]
MDFWSRLLSHASISTSTSRKDAAKDPAKRLHRFEREYAQLLQVWRNTSNLPRDFEAAEKLEIRLDELTSILSDETRRPLPHPCIQFASIKQIYAPIGKIATTSSNEWIVKSAVLFFATLVESEEEAFVESHNFSSSLTNLLVRITGQNSVRLGRDTEAKVVELAFNITTKIRLQPSILDVWFQTPHQAPHHHAPPGRNHQNQERQAIGDRERFAGRMQKQDFPLFYILMDYIQHEGRVGDFARTGLLYIIECAAASVPLEQWIVESDLSTLMATGLGALYSQLSRKLVVDYPAHELPPVLALSDYQHPTSNYEIVASCSPEFQAHLETFLSHLLFWQDVLNHCRSLEVKSTLLEHFQVIFLQQLLYPSLLESSDIDGGSSVAVITYLRRILESLDHPDMINLILHYLLALPDSLPSVPPPNNTSVSDARKRKSLDLLTMMAAENLDLSVTPLLFNLVDLTLACLRSHSQQTIHVTLQLVSAILKRHHRYAILTLLRTEALHESPSSTRRTAGAHNQEVDYLMSLAGSIGGQDNFDEVYENTIQDAMTRLESHPCSLKLVAPRVSTNNHDLPAIPDSLPGAPPDVTSHTLLPDDPLLGALLDILDTFFINPIDTNLSVTETITDLAICGYMGIEGWLLRSAKTYSYNESSDPADPVDPADLPSSTSPTDSDFDSASELAQIQARQKCTTRPRWEKSTLPRVLIILGQLVDQISKYRETIPRFDELLQQRREAFQTADSAPTPQPKSRTHTPAPAPAPAAAEMTSDTRGDSPARPSALEGFAHRLLSELGSPSRSSSPRGASPRGRKDRVSAAVSGGYGIGTPGPAVPPKEFSLNYEVRPLGRSYSPVSGGEGAKDPLVASQKAAFAAVDQSILARRVGIPGRAVIPLRFKAEGDAGVSPEENTEEQTEHSEGQDQTESEGNGRGHGPAAETVSVSHVLTNALILQSFIMELAGLVQVRAGLFNEVRFT